MKRESITQMRNASYLLPDPGGEVVRSLLCEIERLQDLLIRRTSAPELFLSPDWDKPPEGR